MVSEQVISEIKQRVDLLSLVGLQMRQVGKVYQALCPFHTEKTASFTVYPESNSWHCFGACNEGGDVFSFVQKRDNLSFREALEYLAGLCGIELSESAQQSALSARRAKLQALCQVAAEQFQKWLLRHAAGQSCRDYVAGRGLSDEMVDRFMLGYAPNSWNSLSAVLSERGYEWQDMLTVGLVRQGNQGGYYDAFRHRLIFPIRDSNGKIIGFGGRALDNEQKPKYLNSPQTPLFKKSQVLYGLDLAKQAIRTNGAVVVEGYMDCITAHQAGFSNVVASLGTAITNQQLDLLARYSPTLTLALDADAGGKQAMQRVLLGLLTEPEKVERQRHIRVLTLPTGLDPDALIKESKAEWPKLVAGALPVIDYLIEQRTEGRALEELNEKMQVANDLLPMIGSLTSALQREHYVTKLATLLHVSSQSLTRDMLGFMRHQPAQQTAPPKELPPLPKPEPWRDLEAYLLYLLLYRPSPLRRLRTIITPDMWHDTLHREIWAALCKSEPTDLDTFTTQLDGVVATRMQTLYDFHATYFPISPPNWRTEITKTIYRFLIRARTQQLKRLTFLLAEQTRGDNPQFKRLWQQRTELMQDLRSWKEKLRKLQQQG